MRSVGVAVSIALFGHSVEFGFEYASGQKVVSGGCPCIECIKIIIFV